MHLNHLVENNKSSVVGGIHWVRDAKETQNVAGTSKTGTRYVNLERARKLWTDRDMSQLSQQKVKVLQDLGVTPKQFLDVFASQKEFNKFLADHETSHLNNKDHINYPKQANGKPDLNSPKTLEIEKRAILDALTKEQKEKLGIGEKTVDTKPVYDEKTDTYTTMKPAERARSVEGKLAAAEMIRKGYFEETNGVWKKRSTPTDYVVAREERLFRTSQAGTVKIDRMALYDLYKKANKTPDKPVVIRVVPWGTPEGKLDSISHLDEQHQLNIMRKNPSWYDPEVIAKERYEGKVPTPEQIRVLKEELQHNMRYENAKGEVDTQAPPTNLRFDFPKKFGKGEAERLAEKEKLSPDEVKDILSGRKHSDIGDAEERRNLLEQENLTRGGKAQEESIGPEREDKNRPVVEQSVEDIINNLEPLKPVPAASFKRVAVDKSEITARPKSGDKGSLRELEEASLKPGVEGKDGSILPVTLKDKYTEITDSLRERQDAKIEAINAELEKSAMNPIDRADAIRLLIALKERFDVSDLKRLMLENADVTVGKTEAKAKALLDLKQMTEFPHILERLYYEVTGKMPFDKKGELSREEVYPPHSTNIMNTPGDIQSILVGSKELNLCTHVYAGQHIENFARIQTDLLKCGFEGFVEEIAECWVSPSNNLSSGMQ